MKCLLVSASASITGEWWRLCHMAHALQRHCEVEFLPSLPFCLPFRLYLFISLPFYMPRIVCSNADVFICNKPGFNVTLPLLIVKYILKKKIVIDIDEPDFLYVNGIPSAIIAALQKPFPRFFDCVTYHNDLLRDYSIKEFGVPEQKLFQVKQGVDLKQFKPSGITVKKGALFFMGSLDVASSLDSILHAVKKVQLQHEASFTVAGTGLCASRFKDLAAELEMDVTFTGVLALDKVIGEIAAAEVCLVYYDEIEVNRYRCSMKLREYLAMGKKVACNDFGEMKRFAGVTYQSSSQLDDFAAKICRALTASDGREHRAREFIKNNYDWEEIGGRLFNKIQSMGA